MAKKLIEIEGEFTQENILKALAQYIEGVIGGADRWVVGQRLVQLALRSAARVLPLIVKNDGLSFFGGVDNQLKQLAKLLHIVSYISNRSYPDATNYGNLAVHYVGLQSNSNRATDSIITVVNAAAAAATDIGMPDASITTIASSGAVISDLDVSFSYLDCRFVDEWKQDFQHMQLSGDLWGEPLWRPLSDNYSKLILRLFEMVDHLRESRAGASDDWRAIDEGVVCLKNQIEPTGNDNNVISDFAKGEDSSKEQIRRYSYEATHISHAETPALEDKLNRQKLVNALAVNLVSPTNNHHRAIGLLGEWGSGKSTVLDLLKQRLQESNSEQPFIFGEFNAWAYEHTDNIQAGVAQEMINALTGSPDVLQPLYAPTASFFEKLKTILSSDLRKIFAAILNAIPVSSNMSLRWLSERCALTLRFAYKVHPVELLKILLLLLVAAMPWFSDWFHGLIEFSESPSNKSSWIWTAGVLLYTLREFGKLIISPQAKELLTYLRLPSYAEHLGTIPVMRKHIYTLCNLRLKEKNGKNTRLLFLVDDLDRCSPSAIVKVLEAVRLVLDLDNVTVIIAIDQHIALAALSEHFKDFSPHHKLKNSHAIAREYLSKVINLPIVLTKPSSDDVRIFMGSFWEEMNKTVEKEINESNPQLETADTTDVSESGGVSTTGDGRLDRGNITQHASTAGDKVPDTQAADTVDLDGSEQSNAEVEPPPMMKPVKALSRDQQESFILWVNYFELSNSRQLKRLNNSYDLMRSYVPLMDKDVSEFEFSDSPVSKVYSMLLTLILMEYLNSLHDLKERNQLWDQLFRESTPLHSDVVGNRLVSTDFIKAYRNLLAAEGNQTLVSSVEAFVLPAMN